MNRRTAVLVALWAAAGLGGPPFQANAAAPAAPPPELAWAYPTAAPGTPELRILPGSYRTPNGERRLNAAEVDALTPADQDWFPRGHPAPPAVVLKAPSPNGPAPCAECHGMTGRGMVGVPDLAGLKADYLMEQLSAFRSGARTSAEPGRLGTQVMIGVAKGWSATDLKAAASYFSSLPRRSPTRVIVSETAPAMKMERFGWTYVDPAGGRARPLQGRVAEAPDSLVKAYMGDPSGRELVWVSQRTLDRGRALVRTGGDGGQPCATCHGSSLRGSQIAPPLSGRDPGYLARQLWDIRSGARRGPRLALMQGPAKGLSPADMTAAAAYLASLKP